MPGAGSRTSVVTDGAPPASAMHLTPVPLPVLLTKDPDD